MAAKLGFTFCCDQTQLKKQQHKDAQLHAMMNISVNIGDGK